MKEEQESWILQSYIIRKRKIYRFSLNEKENQQIMVQNLKCENMFPTQPI